MVAERRFGPLIAAVFMGLLALVVRLCQIQVVEHEIWAREATNLVRSARTEPYLRGRITDREGVVFVEDERAYAVEFVYRDFRRRHPLGQVCHARSALEGRGVGIEEALSRLLEWGTALIDATPQELLSFERGEAVRLCGERFPAVERGEDRRRGRAGELRFYTRGLLGVSPRNWSRIKKLLKGEEARARSWAGLVAEVEGRGAADVRARVRGRLESCVERLGQLAWQLGVSGPDGVPARTRDEALRFLVAALEKKRQQIEDAIATDLFLEAAGFHPGRLEPDLLVRTIDLDWIADRHGWNAPRLETWALCARREWLHDQRTFHVPAAQIRARLRSREGGERAFEALAGELAVLFARRPRTPREWRERSRDWRRIDRVAVFAELEDLVEGLDGSEVAGEAPLPFLEPWIREATRAHPVPASAFVGLVPFEHAGGVAGLRPWRLELSRSGEEREEWKPPASPEEAGARLARLLGVEVEVSADDRDGAELLPWVVDLWEVGCQRAFGEVLAALAALAEADGLPAPLPLDRGRRKRAEKKADYSTRDRGSRPEIVDESPGEAVVLLLTRYPEEYRGFGVLARTRRLALGLDRDGELIARELIGKVRESTLEETLEQQLERQKLATIVRKEKRTEADREEFEALVAQLYRNDEVHGTSGLEGLLDPVLRGENGFVEEEGLQQRHGESRSPLFKEVVNGLDVTLTLSADLQVAAQDVIEHPVLPSSETRRDEVWFENPVGAIVLATVDGEILAAASGPKRPHAPFPGRDHERSRCYDRTLRRPGFRPLGSIFKPFVAAYALDRLGLDPSRELHCEVRPEHGSAGWGQVACWQKWGHHGVGLVDAIEGSCNAYFAQVGEMLGDRRSVREAARIFGFDRPTGVKSAGGGSGLTEDFTIPSLRSDREFRLTDLHRAGNGLSVIEGTPVQAARAFAGLATGLLPEMRLVRAIDGRALEPRFEAIPISAGTLALLRRAMRGVIERGTAHGKGLSREELGFAIAAKTGSADYRTMSDDYRAQLIVLEGSAPQVRKHTWFAGFFPYEDPRAVVIVYCHDIGVTASHSAVHVAAQFLKTPAVQAFVQGAMR